MASKEIVFRSKYGRHTVFMGAKKIQFVKFLYRTEDAKEIQFLRDQTKKNNTIKEIQPAKKIAAIEMEEGETEDQAIARVLASKKASKQPEPEKSKDKKEESDANKKEDKSSKK